MRRSWWWLFFLVWPIVAIAWSVVAPGYGWWFHESAESPLGRQIDDLFYLILIIVSVVFVGTHIALVYVVWKYGDGGDRDKGWFTHGSHSLEVIWTITPAGVLLFISLYQMDVWMRFRMTRDFATEVRLHPIAEVTARQFEWRIRYPASDRVFKSEDDITAWLAKPQPDDLYSVNDLHVPAGQEVLIHLRTEDVLHSFFIPALRVKQDAVPGFVIPIQFEASKNKVYDLVCAELCGWGHYKMKGQIVSESQDEFKKYLEELKSKQNDDGYRPPESTE